MAALEQRVDDVRADEAGAAGDEDHGARRLCVRARARRHPAGAQRARGAAVGARADARRLRRRSSSTTARPTARASSRRRSARGSWPSRVPGFGAACFAGLSAARRPTSSASWTATPRSTRASCRASPTRSRPATADLVLGARRPTPRGAWPLHARAANAVLALELRRRTGVPLRDLGPMRAARREALLALGIRDRRFGWPLEMVLRAAAAGWTIREVAGRLPPARRALEGHRHGARDRPRGARHDESLTVTCQIRVIRTRLGHATDLVAPALHRDRQGAGPRAGQDPPEPAVHARRRPPRSRARRCRTRSTPRRGARAPAGASSCSTASRAPGCRPASRSSPQRGDGLAERLAAAFDDVGEPGLPGRDGHAAGHAGAARRRACDAVDRRRLGLRRRARRRLLGASACARPTRGLRRRADEQPTHRRRPARAAARRSACSPAILPPLRDVDTFEDALAVAAEAPDTRFAAGARPARQPRWR